LTLTMSQTAHRRGGAGHEDGAASAPSSPAGAMRGTQRRTEPFSAHTTDEQPHRPMHPPHHDPPGHVAHRDALSWQQHNVSGPVVVQRGYASPTASSAASALPQKKRRSSADVGGGGGGGGGGMVDGDLHSASLTRTPDKARHSSSGGGGIDIRSRLKKADIEQHQHQHVALLGVSDRGDSSRAAIGAGSVDDLEAALALLEDDAEAFSTDSTGRLVGGHRGGHRGGGHRAMGGEVAGLGGIAKWRSADSADDSDTLLPAGKAANQKLLPAQKVRAGKPDEAGDIRRSGNWPSSTSALPVRDRLGAKKRRVLTDIWQVSRNMNAFAYVVRQHVL
jgi:hypothetical protein